MWFRNIFNAKSDREPTGDQTEVRDPDTLAGSLSSDGVLSARAVALLNRLRLDTGRIPLNRPSGSRSSTVRKTASDFREHRAYVPGDDVRYVDWKASARHEHIYIKQGEQEKAALVTILIDASASMAWGKPSKASAAITLAHALGYMALAQGDRLLVLPVSGQENNGGSLPPLGPLWGKGQAPQLMRYLQAVRFGGRIDLPLSLASIAKRNIADSGLVLVISDLLSTQQLGAVRTALAPPAWRIVFLHLLHPQELDPGLNGYMEMVDIETGQKKLYMITPEDLKTYAQQIQGWRLDLAEKCAGIRAEYTLISSGASLENEVLPQLRQERIVKSL